MKLVPLILFFALPCFAQPTNPSVNVVAWGYNAEGQTNVPPDLTNAVAVAGGGFHSLALKADGHVVGWGWNASGECNVSIDVTNVLAISAADTDSAALLVDGAVRAWGDNH